MTDSWRERHFVFVGGMHRSGTTYLADLFRTVPEAACLVETGVSKDEGQHLQDVYPTGGDMGGSPRWTFDPRFHLVESDADAVPDAADRLWGSWRPFLSVPQASHVVEKTPLNLTKTRFLQRIFTNSSFVVVTRHPITQALAHSKWATHDVDRQARALPSLVEQWVRAHEAFAEDEPLLERSLVLRFEEVARDPGRARDQMLDLVGLPRVQGTVDPMDPRRVHSYTRRWESATRRGAGLRAAARLPRRVGRHEMAARDLVDALRFRSVLRELRRRFDGRIAALGYDLMDTSTARPWRSSDRADAG